MANPFFIAVIFKLSKNVPFCRAIHESPVIPKEYREFYHLDYNDEVFIVDTKDGLLITNHKYKVVEVENENSAQ